MRDESGSMTTTAAPHRGAPARIAILAGTLVLALAYLIPGLIGHDPWKQDEAYSFGIIHNMVQTGDLVVPTLAADPFMEKPPAYYITATGLVRLLEGVLPAHDAARLTSGLYMGLALLFTGLLARRTWGPGLGPPAVLLAIGTLGLLLNGHFIITDTALTAGMVMAYYGLLRAPQSRWGGLWLGTGAGLAFLSKGLLGPGILGIGGLLLFLFPTWRTRGYLKSIGLAIVAALPWLTIWPTALYLRSPDLFHLWFWDNNFGRFLGSAGLGPPTQPWYWVHAVAYMTIPTLPLALWTLWSQGRAALTRPGVQLALAISAVGWGLLFSSRTARDLYSMPLLPLLAVLAAGGLDALPRGAVRLGYWFSAGLFGLMALILWGFWVYGVTQGQPPQWAFVGTQLPLDYRFTFSLTAFLIALAFQVGWTLILLRWRPPRTAALLAWPAGLILVWALLGALHLPWIDQAKSYRGLFNELRAQLPERFNCLADINFREIRECERGMLHSVTGLTTEHVATPADTRCDYLVVETNLRVLGREIEAGPGWERIWQGSLAPVHRDLFSLFRRVPSAQSPGATPGPAP